MIDNRVSALLIVNSNRKIDQTMIIVACDDMSVHMLKHHTSKYIFNTFNEVDQIFACFECDNLTLACLIKCTQLHEKFQQCIQVKQLLLT